MADYLLAAVARGMMQGFLVLLWIVRTLFSITAYVLNSRERIPKTPRPPKTAPLKESRTRSTFVEPSAPIPEVIAGVTFTITLPQNTEWDGRRAYQFIEQLLIGFPALVFRIIGTSISTYWQIVDFAEYSSSAIETAIRSTYPEATITVTSFEPEVAEQLPVFRTVLKYELSAETFLAPLLYAPDIKHPDPLSSIVEVMGDLYEGERLTYWLFVDGVDDEAYREGEKHVSKNVYGGSAIGLLNPQKADRYTPEITRVLLAKLQERLYRVSLFIQIDTPYRNRIATLLTINNHLAGFSRPLFGSLQPIQDGQGAITVTDTTAFLQTSALSQYKTIRSRPEGFFQKDELKRRIALTLEPREIATLWHLPHQAFTSSKISWSFGTVRSPNILRGKTEGVCIGLNDYAGRVEPIYIPDRSSHVSIVGKTGVGKTTLMHQLIHQDIAAGRGVAVIDPHGKLVSDILHCSIPSQRQRDVIVLDIADEYYPIPLNLLAAPQDMEQGNAAAQLMGILDRLYDLSSTPTVADTMWASLVTLASDKSATIRDINKLLTQEDYRRKLVAGVTNVAAIEFWERFEAQPGSRENLVRPVLRRLRSLYGNSVLYPIFCHPDTIDFAPIIDQNKILLISLKAYETRIPAREQYLVGLILLTRLQQTVMARSPGSRLYHLYVDEVQHFVTTTFDTLLSEARKYGLSLTTANQYLKQLAGNMLDSIMGNVGTMIAFQTGLNDAKVLAPYFSPDFDADRLMHLDAYEAAVSTRYKSKALPAFSIKTKPPLSLGLDPKKGKAREQELRELSQKQYLPRSRSDVLAWLAAKYPEADDNSDPLDGIVYWET